jgi:hypothetical protein
MQLLVFSNKLITIFEKRKFCNGKYLKLLKTGRLHFVQINFSNKLITIFKKIKFRKM